jgi:DNA-binding transcriptional MerR regulator
MSKQTPAAPDYTGAANAQAQSSREVTEQQTWANRPTINTPFGQQTWEVKPTWDPSTGQYLNSWTQDTNLTPQAQSALDAQMNIQQGKSNIAQGMLGRVQNEYSQPMDWDHLTQLADTPQGQQIHGNNYSPEDIQRGVGDTPDYIKSAGDAIYGQWSDRQEPLMAQQKDQMRTQLYNQGLKEGDQAYDAEMRKLENQQSDARQQAQYQATIGSGQEAQRMQGMDVTQGQFHNQASQQALQQQLGIGGQQFNENMQAGGQNFNQGMQSANYQNSLRQQQIAEDMQKRGFSLNEINAILNGQQVSMPNMPGFSQANASQAAQYNQAAQNQGQYALDAFSAQQQQMNSLMSGAGSAAMMFSDRRLKKDIQPMPENYDWPPYIKWYSYHYVWESDEDPYHIGVMADEVENIPGVVHVDPVTGYKMVDYGRL